MLSWIRDYFKCQRANCISFPPPATPRPMLGLGRAPPCQRHAQALARSLDLDAKAGARALLLLQCWGVAWEGERRGKRQRKQQWSEAGRRGQMEAGREGEIYCRGREDLRLGRYSRRVQGADQGAGTQETRLPFLAVPQASWGPWPSHCPAGTIQ